MSQFRPNPDDPSPFTPGLDPTIARRDPGNLRRDANGGAMWGWIAGLSVLILIGFIVAGGWGSGSRTGTDTAANAPARTTPPAATTGAAPADSGAPRAPISR